MTERFEETNFPVIYLDHKTESINLDGPQGNTFALIGIGKGWLRDIEQPGLASQFSSEMTSGDYEHALSTFDKWFDTYLLEQYSDLERD